MSFCIREIQAMKLLMPVIPRFVTAQPCIKGCSVIDGISLGQIVISYCHCSAKSPLNSSLNIPLNSPLRCRVMETIDWDRPDGR